MTRLLLAVDSRIRLPPGLPKGLLRTLRSEFAYSNPEFHKKRAMGLSTWNIPSTIRTMVQEDGGSWTAPRGAARRLRELLEAEGYRVRFQDLTRSAPVDFPGFAVDPEDVSKVLRWYQQEAVAAALRYRQGIIRAPTGSGKTKAALAFAAEAGERTLVIVRDRNLQDQWVREGEASLGLPRREIGMIRGGRNYRPGPRLTVALAQSLYSKGNQLDRLLAEEPFGNVIVDEAQTVAARTFQEVIDRFDARYRIGWSADETRKDKMEFLTYDAMGPVIYEVERQTLEEEKVIHPVTVRVVPTDFRADWYRVAEPGEKDWQGLLQAMVEDEERNRVILDLVQDLVRREETPALVFTHRREHARELAVDHLQIERGIRAGLLMGGAGADHRRFQLDLQGLLSGQLPVGVGIFQALGVGHDLPAIRAGVVATPISGSNPQFFGQVRGRICRAAPGKDRAVIYYLLDKSVFPDQHFNLWKWNDGKVEYQKGGQWVEAESPREIASADGW